MAKAVVEIPVWEKYILTIDEASAYFNIGQKKLRNLVNLYRDSPNTFAIDNGNNFLINRKKFEEFIDATSCV